MALSKRRVAAVTPEPVASSRRNVREQSRVVYYNGNIITFLESDRLKNGSVITLTATEI